MPNDELMTMSQVAERLGKSLSTTGRLVRSGQLAAAVKVPGRTGAYLFDPDEVARFKREQATSAA